VPELAEVEFYRKQWDAGIGARITKVAAHTGKRIFRGTSVRALRRALTGAVLRSSEARAKQMLFRFSRGRSAAESAWLGIHLGMTGRLRTEPRRFQPGRHDHLVLITSRAALVLQDMRMFGRVRFAISDEPPLWWTGLPPAVTSADFTIERLRAFLQRRARLAVKAALLVQTIFPGVGNWMADEILWRARIQPGTLCGRLAKERAEALWKSARAVCEQALATVGIDFSEPPAGWLYHVRWQISGRCPRCSSALKRSTIGGRTTRWCAKCQR
jgi:formamidopyrimidine-DNA glycosylase